MSEVALFGRRVAGSRPGPFLGGRGKGLVAGIGEAMRLLQTIRHDLFQTQGGGKPDAHINADIPYSFAAREPDSRYIERERNLERREGQGFHKRTRRRHLADMALRVHAGKDNPPRYVGCDTRTTAALGAGRFVSRKIHADNVAGKLEQVVKLRGIRSFNLLNHHEIWDPEALKYVTPVRA